MIRLEFIGNTTTVIFKDVEINDVPRWLDAIKHMVSPAILCDLQNRPLSVGTYHAVVYSEVQVWLRK